MIARKSLLIMGSRLVMNFAGFVSWYFIAHYILINYTSSVGFAISYLGLLGLITDIGFSNAHVKRVSEGKDIGRCVGTYASIKITLLGLFAGLVFFSFFFYKNIYPGWDFANDYDQKVITLMLAWFIFSGLSQIPIQTFIGRQQMAKAQTALVISALVQSIVTIVIVLNYNNVYYLAYTWIIGSIVTLIASYLLFIGTPVKLPTFKFVKSYTSFALPLMFVAGATPIALNMDKVMIKLFLTDTAVGLYWNAQKYAQLPDALTQSVSTVLFPAMSSIAASGSMSHIKKITHSAERYLSMIIFPGAFILAAISEPFVYIFSGPQYVNSSIILSILMGWAVMKTLARPYSTHFLAFNKTKYFMVTSSAYLVTVMITNLVFIPDDIYGVRMLGLGAPGAALATLLAVSVNYFIIRWLSRRIIKTGFNRSIMIHLFSAGITGILLILLQWVHAIGRIYELVGYALLGIFVYLLLLRVMNEFTKRDLDFFLDTFNVRKMYEYIVDELFGFRKKTQ